MNVIFFIGKSHNFLGLEDSSVLLDETHLVEALGAPLTLPSPSRSSPRSQGSENGERFSRKVFVGGLPPDIDEGQSVPFYLLYLHAHILFYIHYQTKKKIV